MHSIARCWHVLFLALFVCVFLLPMQPALAATGQVIYDDATATGWENWSWGSTINLGDTSTVQAGSKSISVTAGAWAALYLHHSGIATDGYSAFQFYVNGGSNSGKPFLFCLNTACTGATYAFTPKANTWTKVTIPLSDLGNPTVLGDLIWKENSGSSLSAVYFDEIALVNDATTTNANSPVLTSPSILPAALQPGGEAIVRVKATDPQGNSDISSVTVNASTLGAGTLTLRDDGRNNDGAANDGVFGAVLKVGSGIAVGEYSLSAAAIDASKNSATLNIGNVAVLAQPGGSIPAKLPQRIGWGVSEWFVNGSYWPQASGVAWDYNYRYITYEWYEDPSRWGNYVQQVTSNAWNNNQIPVITVYMLLAAGPDTGEGGSAYASKLQDASTVSGYLAALTQAAKDANGSKPVIFHLEPDFYGFMQQLSNSSSKPAGVKADDPTSFPVALNVAGYPNTLAGFGKRMVDVVHQNAPNALVGVHASGWATNSDPNSGTAQDTISLAKRTVAFMDKMGGAQADLYFLEWSDRDAGSGLRPFWDDTNRSLPRFTRSTLWENTISASAGKRLMLWQVPAGNMGLGNTCNQYRDNKAAYAFNHARDLVNAGIIGVMFGAGAGCMTTPSNDGGFIVGQATIAYAAPATPSGLSSQGVVGNLASVRWTPSSENDVVGYQVSYSGPSGSGKLSTGPLANTSLLLSIKGSYQIRVAAVDAQGRVSSQSSAITVTVSANATQTFVPLMMK